MKIQKNFFPHAVEVEHENDTLETNEEIISYLQTMHGRLLAPADPALFFSPEEETEQFRPSEEIFALATILRRQIGLLCDDENDAQLLEWVADSDNVDLRPYLDDKEVAIDLSMHADIFQRLKHSTQAGHAVVVTNQDSKVFQKLVNGLRPEQRETLAARVSTISAETIHERYLVGSKPLPQAIRIRAELLKRIRSGTLFASE